jgi:hypothetical protein
LPKKAGRILLKVILSAQANMFVKEGKEVELVLFQE